MQADPLPKEGLLIIGTGLLARWAAQIAETCGDLVYGFAPTRLQKEKEWESLSILPPITRARIWKLIQKGEAGYVVALTDPVARERMAHAVFARTRRVARGCIHPSFFLAASAEIGGGAIVFPYVVVGISARIGGYVVIESHTAIGAGTVIEDFVNVGSGCQIGESCYIASYSWIGRGAVIEAGIRVGKGAQILPGAVVRENVGAGEIYGS
ncbi:MAG: hypothetical protein NZ958_01260 [Bacteroidia bacterium]|nr:hypothetical protein [Bacteroidia bacterium]MDW8089292.1 hypothetical protein [Bacteroidia bacterium]